MKCEIVKDLLPLYVENLCSAESREAVASHLDDCARCRELCAQMSGQIRTDGAKREDEAEEIFLPEKDLLSRVKTAIRGEFVQKLQRRLGAAIFSLGLVCNAAMFALALWGYDLKNPKLSFAVLGPSQVWLLLLPFLPTLLGLSEYLAARGKQKNRTKTVFLFVNTALLLPSVLLGALFTALFLAIPPLGSVTDDPSRYLQADAVFDRAGRCESALEEFFPPRIPGSASEVSYHYARHPALFSETLSMECSYVLPPVEYEASRDRALAFLCRNREETDADAKPNTNAKPNTVAEPDAAAKPNAAQAKSPFSHTLSRTFYPGLCLSFTYDDESRRVEYLAEYEADR